MLRRLAFGFVALLVAAPSASAGVIFSYDDSVVDQTVITVKLDDSVTNVNSYTVDILLSAGIDESDVFAAFADDSSHYIFLGLSASKDDPILGLPPIILTDGSNRVHVVFSDFLLDPTAVNVVAGTNDVIGTITVGAQYAKGETDPGTNFQGLTAVPEPATLISGVIACGFGFGAFGLRKLRGRSNRANTD